MPGFRSPLWLLGALLAGSLFVAGCKQGIGDRCEIASDCDTNFCSLNSGDEQNGICCDPTNTQTCIVQGGTGGAVGSSGEGGSGGADASADVSPDVTSDAPATDSSADASDAD